MRPSPGHVRCIRRPSEAIRGHQRHLEASRGRFVWVPTPQARARSCSGSYGLGCTPRDPYLCSSLPIPLARPSQLCSCSAHGRWLIGEPIALRVPGAIPLTGAPVKEGMRPRVVSTRRSRQKGKGAIRSTGTHLGCDEPFAILDGRDPANEPKRRRQPIVRVLELGAHAS